MTQTPTEPKAGDKYYDILGGPRNPKAGDKMSDGTIFAGISPDHGYYMFIAPLTDSLTQQWKAARKLNKNLAYGRRDWRPPSEAELGVLFNNRAAIGGDGAVADPRVRTSDRLYREPPSPLIHIDWF